MPFGAGCLAYRCLVKNSAKPSRPGSVSTRRSNPLISGQSVLLKFVLRYSRSWRRGKRPLRTTAKHPVAAFRPPPTGVGRVGHPAAPDRWLAGVVSFRLHPGLPGYCDKVAAGAVVVACAFVAFAWCLDAGPGPCAARLDLIGRRSMRFFRQISGSAHCVRSAPANTGPRAPPAAFSTVAPWHEKRWLHRQPTR